MSADSSTISITSLQQRIAELEAEVESLKHSAVKIWQLQREAADVWYSWTKDDFLRAVSNDWEILTDEEKEDMWQAFKEANIAHDDGYEIHEGVTRIIYEAMVRWIDEYMEAMGAVM